MLASRKVIVMVIVFATEEDKKTDRWFLFQCVGEKSRDTRLVLASLRRCSYSDDAEPYRDAAL